MLSTAPAPPTGMLTVSGDGPAERDPGRLKDVGDVEIPIKIEITINGFFSSSNGTYFKSALLYPFWSRGWRRNRPSASWSRRWHLLLTLMTFVAWADWLRPIGPSSKGKDINKMIYKNMPSPKMRAPLSMRPINFKSGLVAEHFCPGWSYWFFFIFFLSTVK